MMLYLNYSKGSVEKRRYTEVISVFVIFKYYIITIYQLYMYITHNACHAQSYMRRDYYTSAMLYRHKRM